MRPFLIQGWRNYQLGLQLPTKSNCRKAARLNLRLRVPGVWLAKPAICISHQRSIFGESPKTIGQNKAWQRDRAERRSRETYQQKNFAVWFHFMLLHVLDEAAICIPVKGKYLKLGFEWASPYIISRNPETQNQGTGRSQTWSTCFTLDRSQTWRTCFTLGRSQTGRTCFTLAVTLGRSLTLFSWSLSVGLGILASSVYPPSLYLRIS